MMGIKKIFPHNPLEVIHSGFSFVHKWCLLLKADDRGKVSKLVDQARTCISSFTPSGALNYDMLKSPLSCYL
jgi:hypothetical protein